MARKYVDVAPAIPLPAAKYQVFTYHTSKAIQQHQLVRVPFGRRTIKGVVIDVHRKRPHYRTKEVVDILPTTLSTKQVEFAQWIARTMQGGLGYTLRLCMPPAGKEESTAFSKPVRQSVRSMAVVGSDAERAKEIAAQIKSQKHQALVVVPELWMIPYMQELLLLHGVEADALSGKESVTKQRSVWYGVAAGKVQVVIGTQKALYLPYRQLGLVVIEQEQYAAHKLWDQYPRLDGRLAASRLAEIHRAHLLYASSFPSVVLRHLMDSKEVEIIRDKLRYPKIDVIEASIEDRRARRLLPNDFVKELKQRVKAGRRVLLLYNQLDTGQKGRKGFGTETLERVFEAFPALKKQLVRIDRRSKKDVGGKEELERRQVIFGTSAVLAAVDGMQFDYVVWLFPERSLSYPDYRTVERSVALLARLQNYLPKKQSVTIVTRNRHVVTEVLGQSKDAYYANQLKERKRFAYPPFADVVKLSVTSKTTEIAEERASLVRQEIEKRGQDVDNILVRGPFQDLGSSSRDKHAAHVLLQGDLEALTSLYEKLPIDGVDVCPHRIL